MIDLGIYLAGLGLGLEETLVGFRSSRIIEEPRADNVDSL
jgi:hypothetical protein